MALTLGRLVVKLEADAGGLFSGLAGAAQAVEKFAKRAKEMSGNLSASAGAITAAAAAATALAATVDLKTSRSVDALRRDTALFAVQVADVVAPAMREMGNLFRQAAAFVAGLSPALKASIGHFAEMAAGVAFAAKGVQLLMGVLAPAASMLSAFFGLFSGATLAGTASALIGVVAILAVVAGAVTLLHRAWRLNWGGMQDATREVLGDLVSSMDNFKTIMVGLGAIITAPFLALIRAMIAAVDEYNKLAGVLPGGQGLTVDTKGAKEALAGLTVDIFTGKFWKNGLDFGKKLGQDVGNAFAEEWTPLLDRAKAAFKGLFTGGGPVRMPSLVEPSKKDTGYFDPYTQSGLDVQKLQEQFAELTDELGPALAGFDALSPGLETAVAAIRKMADAADQAAIEERTQKEVRKQAKIAAAQAEFERQLQGVGQIALSGMTRAMGAVGDLVNSAVQGAQAGGVMGAIVAVFMDLLAKTQSVARFAGAALDAVGQIVAALEPVVAPIMDALMKLLGPIIDIFKTIFDILGPFFQQIAGIISALAPVLKLIGTVLKFLGPVLQAIFVIIGTIVGIIMSIILPIVAFFQELFGQHLAAADTMKSLDELWTAIGTPVANSANGAATALDGTAAAAQAVTESLMNVPEGYKVNEARFKAAIAEGDYTMPGGTTPGLPGPVSGSTYTAPPITFNGDLVVQAQDPEDLLAQLHARVVRINGQRYGTPAGAGAP